MATSPQSVNLLRMLLPLGFGLVTYILALNAGSRLLGDPDVYMHIAVGRWIIAHGFLPHEDVFSHSMRGAPWVLHEWLSEVIFAYIYEYSGWIGLVVLTGVAFALAFVLLTRTLLVFLSPTYALVGAMTAWAMCVPNLLARPHMLVYPLLVGWVAALVVARSRDRAPSPWTALLMVLWANLHGSFIIGIVLAALFGAEALFETNDRKSAGRVAVHWGIFWLLSVAAAIATPNGIAGLLLPFDVARMSFALSWIIEWKSPDFQSPQPIEIWLLLMLFGALFLGIRLPIARIAMLLILLHMTLQHRRHGALLGLITPLLIAPALVPQLRNRFEGFIGSFFKREELRQALPGAVAVVVVFTFLLAVGTTVWRRGLAHDVDRITPSAALAAAKQNEVAGPVFNDFNFGGFLIFSGIPTFIDGRADMYGDRFIRRYAQSNELPQLLEQYKISWTLLGVEDPGVLLLDHLPGWRRLHADTIAVVHVREKVPAP